MTPRSEVVGQGEVLGAREFKDPGSGKMGFDRPEVYADPWHDKVVYLTCQAAGRDSLSPPRPADFWGRCVTAPTAAAHARKLAIITRTCGTVSAGSTVLVTVAG